MATAEEKESKQAVRDIARASIVQGKQRQAAEIPRAGGAYPARRLRSAGDLSRYAIGGFAGDPLAPINATPPKAKKPAARRATTTTKKAAVRQTYRVGAVQFKRFQS